MQKNYLYLLALLCVWSCSKDSDGASQPDMLYGSWKTNYGDTVVFLQKNGVPVASLTAKLNPQQAPVSRRDHAYDYRDSRLWVTATNGSATTYVFNITWTEQGRSFQIRDGDWFSLYSTGLGVIVFTKIP